MAEANGRTALWIVEEGGGEVRLSFAELAERSNRVANHLRAQGVRRGDPLLLMLGNVAPLWECMRSAGRKTSSPHSAPSRRATASARNAAGSA
jgi:acetyl-CoA synthetase